MQPVVKFLLAALFVALCSSHTYAQSQPDVGMTAEQLMTKVYGDFSAKLNCWPMQSDNERYCMRIDRVDKIVTDQGPRLYVLAQGTWIDEAGNESGGHAASGMIGAFVVEVKDGAPNIVAQNRHIPAGEHGASPKKWKFIQLGAANYWGWQNWVGGGGQGYFIRRFFLLAPYGKGIADLMDFKTDYTDPAGTELDTKLEVDLRDRNARVYPLKLTVSGVREGKKFRPKTWIVPFDLKKWQYLEPKDWPLKDL